MCHGTDYLFLKKNIVVASQMSGSPGISAFPEGDNMFKWIGTIEGGNGTVSSNN